MLRDSMVESAHPVSPNSQDDEKAMLPGLVFTRQGGCVRMCTSAKGVSDISIFINKSS